MKLLLVLGSDDIFELISLHLKPLGFETIRYRHVLKAMDNVDEVDPQAIIISASDFPRHWKILVQFIRSERSKEICPIILLCKGELPLEASTQAFYIGVSGIVDESLDTKEVERIQSIMTRYVPTEERRRFPRFFNTGWNRFGLLISNPPDDVIIPGQIKTISASGISFLPVSSGSMKDITLNMILNGCSLRVGERILSPVCRLVRTGRIVSMEFISFPLDEYKVLQKYLEWLPLQELKDKQKEVRDAVE
ncbi:hypothetical protein AGMMS49546_00090 [Spirochaetia bacterium]|nr:hypothetical protein AGMMS49546_00090 [Spirochaetia bacterium]